MIYVTDDEIDARRGTVEEFQHDGRRVVRLWPRHDGEDHVTVRRSTPGLVLLAIEDSNNKSERGAAVVLLVEELERLLAEARALALAP